MMRLDWWLRWWSWPRTTGRYGYRRITAMLRWEGWKVNHKRVERLWRTGGAESPVQTAETKETVAS